MRASLGHSGGNNDLSLLDDLKIPYTWSAYIDHVSFCIPLPNHDLLQEK